MIKYVYNFSATWSPVSKLFDPIFKSISLMDEFKNFIFEFKNVDEDLDLVDKFKLKYIPTIVVADENNNLINSFCGITCKNELIDFLKEKNK